MSKTIIRNYGMPEVISSMRRMLVEASHDTDLRELAISAIHDNPVNDIYDWVKANVQYVPDPVDVELFQHPSCMIREFRAGKNLAGDCDDIALLTVAMSQSVGIKSRIALIDTSGNRLDHAVAQVWSDKLQDWIFCDPSTGKVPFGWSEKYYSIVVV